MFSKLCSFHFFIWYCFENSQFLHNTKITIFCCVLYTFSVFWSVFVYTFFFLYYVGLDRIKDDGYFFVRVYLFFIFFCIFCICMNWNWKSVYFLSRYCFIPYFGWGAHNGWQSFISRRWLLKVCSSKGFYFRIVPSCLFCLWIALFFQFWLLHFSFDSALFVWTISLMLGLLITLVWLAAVKSAIYKRNLSILHW